MDGVRERGGECFDGSYYGTTWYHDCHQGRTSVACEERAMEYWKEGSTYYGLALAAWEGHATLHRPFPSLFFKSAFVVKSMRKPLTKTSTLLPTSGKEKKVTFKHIPSHDYP